MSETPEERERRQALRDIELDRVFIAMLKESGLRSYTGLIPSWNKPVTLEFGPPSPPPIAPTPGQPHDTKLVDAGGGLMVDPDVLGHEGG